MRIDGLDQRFVARHRGEVGQFEIEFAKGGQDACEQYVGLMAFGGNADVRELTVELLLHEPQGLARKDARSQVGLEVEAGQLCIQPVELCEFVNQGQVDGGSLERALVDETHLLLGADAHYVRFEPVVAEHVFQALQIGQDFPDEFLSLRFIAWESDVGYTHESRPAARDIDTQARSVEVKCIRPSQRIIISTKELAPDSSSSLMMDRLFS